MAFPDIERLYIPLDKVKTLLLICLLLAAVFIAFLPSLKNGFVNYDDNEFITNNPRINCVSFKSIRNILTSTSVANVYQPVVMLAFLTEYYFFKLNPFGYHLVSVAVHLANCLLVLWFIYLLSGRLSVSLLAALLFGLHPMRVESVAWATEQKDVLYAFFFIASLISYVYYLRNNKPLRYLCICFFLFFLSIFSKPLAVTLPLVLILIDYLLNRKNSIAMIMDKTPFFLLSVLFGLCEYHAVNSAGAIHVNFASSNILNRLDAAGGLILFYLKNMFFGKNLVSVYLYTCKTTILNISTFVFMIAAIISLLLTGRSKNVVFCALFFLVTLLPVLKFVSGASVMAADRFTYLPFMGICYGIGGVFDWLWARGSGVKAFRTFFFAVLAVVISFFVISTWKRCEVWRDSISLWSDVLRSYPNDAIACNNRAVAYLNKGDFDLAIADCDKAIRLKPREYSCYLCRGDAYCSKGNDEAAIRDYKKAAAIQPRYSHYPDYVVGNRYMKKGKYDQAISSYTRVIQIVPDYGEAYNNRAVAYFFNKQYDESWKDVRKSRELGCGLDPNFVEGLKKASRREK